MNWAKWFLMIAVLGGVASNMEASLIQIDDATETLKLIIDGVTITGNGGKIENYKNTFDPDTKTEFLQFTFTTTTKAHDTFRFYTRMNCNGCEEESSTGGPSDLFLFFAQKGSLQLSITFRSSDTASKLVPPANFKPSGLDPIDENGRYETVFKTVTANGTLVDEFQVRSDIGSPPLPEPTTLALLVSGMGCLGLAGYLKKR